MRSTTDPDSKNKSAADSLNCESTFGGEEFDDSNAYISTGIDLNNKSSSMNKPLAESCLKNMSKLSTVE